MLAYVESGSKTQRTQFSSLNLIILFSLMPDIEKKQNLTKMHLKCITNKTRKTHIYQVKTWRTFENEIQSHAIQFSFGRKRTKVSLEKLK